MVPPIVHAEHRVASRLRAGGATAPATAQPLALSRPIDTRALSRLMAAGAVREVESGRYYLDHAGYAAMRESRFRRILLAMGVVVVVFAIVVLIDAIR